MRLEELATRRPRVLVKPAERRVVALDGLRALSMSAVLLYHGEVSWARGGFLGISLFFTLSGYLITTLLLRSALDDGRVDLRRFWARRYRRILPAAYLTLAGVVLFGATVATEQQLDDLPGAVAAALAQVANWFFIVTDRSYVAIFAAPSPVQHFWSLAIEEQLYLVLPLAVLALLRWTRRPRVLAVVFASAALASTAWMAILFERGASVDRLYYGSDTRAAELLVGAALAGLLHRRATGGSTRSVPGGSALGLAGAAVLVWAFNQVAVTDAALYRGGFGLFALCSGAIVVGLVAGHGPLSRALAWGPVAAFGRITYGVYLVHWPVFLWLTADRTSLEGASLLALRLAVTMALATASYHLVEMPIRERRWSMPSWGRGAVLPVGAAAVIVLAAVGVGTRDVETDLAGLGEGLAAMPVADDGVLDVLVIADDDGADRADELRSIGGAAVRTTEARFECDTDAAATGTCPAWTDSWAELVDTAQPDVVLLAVTEWDEADLARASGATDTEAQTAWATEALDSGFDILTGEGATVVWAPRPPADLAEARERSGRPFDAALFRLGRERPDLRRRKSNDPSVAALLDDLRLYGGVHAPLPRVMVVGDSTARTLAYGLERWAADEDRAVVWSGATEGCGILDEGRTRNVIGQLVEAVPACKGLVDVWSDAAAEFQPDAVVVLSHIFDLQDRELDGQMVAPGDPEFDAHLVERYTAAYDAFSASGAHVIWLTNPCRGSTSASNAPGSFDADRVRHVNEDLLPEVQAARPELQIFDLHAVLCHDGAHGARPDGLHFSPEGSRWFADTYGEDLLEDALR